MIVFDRVTKSFRGQHVLNALSLRIDGSDRVALIGSNGAGKTTMIRCLLGEYTYEGSITVDGRSPREERCGVLAAIGFVPQLPPPLKMPVGELVRFAACVSGADPAETIRFAERLGLHFAEVRSKPFVRLSGGQKQKILVAIALSRKTGLLIFDEPTANLDPASRRVLFEALAERSNQPLIISSHRLEEVAGLVNRVVDLDHGRVALDDKVEDGGRTNALQTCRLTLVRPEAAFARAIREWGFTSSHDGLAWHGEVAGADRLRFLGMLARYAGLLAAIHLEPDSRPAVLDRAAE